MRTALLVARNVVTGTRGGHWKVNTDADYHDEARVADVGDEERSGWLMPMRASAA